MIAQLLAISMTWQPYIGSPQPTGGTSGYWSGDTVAATEKHARVWSSGEKFNQSSVEVNVNVGPVKVDKITASLYCHVKNAPDGYSVLSSVMQWPPDKPQANRNRKFDLKIDHHAEMPCTVVLWWQLGLWSGGVRTVQAGLGATSEAVPASKAMAVQAAPVAANPATETWTSLPYRIWMDTNYAPQIPAFEICYLSGAITLPNSRFYPPVICNDQRVSVSFGEWCMAMRSIVAGPGVDPQVVARIKSICP